jgi:hypothetical protein
MKYNLLYSHYFRKPTPRAFLDEGHVEYNLSLLEPEWLEEQINKKQEQIEQIKSKNKIRPRNVKRIRLYQNLILHLEERLLINI